MINRVGDLPAYYESIHALDHELVADWLEGTSKHPGA